jgi:DNA repair protein RecO (recombination protein O)
MPLHTTEAIVLRGYQLGEADRIVVLLTRDRGKKRGVAHGARRSRRRFGAALEPLTRVRVAYVERENRELVSLRYAEPLRSPLSGHDPQGPGHAAYFAELIDEWAPQDHPNEKLFRLGAAAVEALADDVPVAALARYFECWLLRLEGVYPAFTACAACRGALGAGGAMLTADADALVCLSCGGGPRRRPDLSPDALSFLQRSVSRPPDALKGVGLAEATTRELERLHGLLLARHLEREPRSARVLRAMGPVLSAHPPAEPPPAATPDPVEP